MKKILTILFIVSIILISILILCPFNNSYGYNEISNASPPKSSPIEKMIVTTLSTILVGAVVSFFTKIGKEDEKSLDSESTTNNEEKNESTKE